MLCRFVLGEGIEKKTNDLAKEVEAQTKAFEEAAAAKKAASAPDSAAPAPEAAAEPAQVILPLLLTCHVLTERMTPTIALSGCSAVVGDLWIADLCL